ncbi:MAG: hypothetical protein HYT72_00405 [Candidatus Aenigmarchaeota archaeon]|nr:hypothetical protein [Candidatus Aenigmarchaeota archaeon]
MSLLTDPAKSVSMREIVSRLRGQGVSPGLGSDGLQISYRGHIPQTGDSPERASYDIRSGDRYFGIATVVDTSKGSRRKMHIQIYSEDLSGGDLCFDADF